MTNHKRGLDSLIDVGIFTGRLKGKAAIVSLTDARSCRHIFAIIFSRQVEAIILFIYSECSIWPNGQAVTKPRI